MNSIINRVLSEEEVRVIMEMTDLVGIVACEKGQMRFERVGRTDKFNLIILSRTARKLELKLEYHGDHC